MLLRTEGNRSQEREKSNSWSFLFFMWCFCVGAMGFNIHNASAAYDNGFVWQRNIDSSNGLDLTSAMDNPGPDRTGHPAWSYEWFLSGSYTNTKPMQWNGLRWSIDSQSPEPITISRQNLNVSLAQDVNAGRSVALMRWINPTPDILIVKFSGPLRLYWLGKDAPENSQQDTVTGAPADVAVIIGRYDSQNDEVDIIVNQVFPYPQTEVIPCSQDTLEMCANVDIDFNVQVQVNPKDSLFWTAIPLGSVTDLDSWISLDDSTAKITLLETVLPAGKTTDEENPETENTPSVSADVGSVSVWSKSDSPDALTGNNLKLSRIRTIGPLPVLKKPGTVPQDIPELAKDGTASAPKAMIAVGPVGPGGSPGIKVNDVFMPGHEDLVVDCANDPDLPNPVTGGGKWGIMVYGSKAQGVEIKNCIIENNQLEPNTDGLGGTSSGGGILMGRGTSGTIHHNTIRFNGSGPSPGSSVGAVDNNIDTQWTTFAGDDHAPHWYAYTLSANETITGLRVLTGSTSRTWNVYFGPSNMWKPDINPDYEAYKIVTDATVGGTPGWQELPLSQTLTQQRVWILISGGPVDDHLYELQYEAGGIWHSPALNEVISCSNLQGGNAGVVMGPDTDVQLYDNIFYDNGNYAVSVNGAKVTIGPNNEFYESSGFRTRYDIWTIGMVGNLDMNIHDNDFHDIGSGIGMQFVSGTIAIADNDFHDFPDSTDTRGIGRQAMSGDLSLNIANNRFWNIPSLTTISMEQTRGYHLGLLFDGNSITGGYTGMKFRYSDNSDISITNNSITDTKRFGIQFQKLGSATTTTNVTIADNTISDNERTGIRTKEVVNTTVRIENNTLTGNAWNPPGNINTHDTLHFRLAEDSAFIISNNTISSSASHPLIRDDGIGFKENTNTNVTISDNSISNHSGAGINFKDNSGGGLVTILNNDINNNDLLGIKFKDNQLDMTTLLGNDITYNGLGTVSADWGGVWFAATDNVHIEKNLFAYNTGNALRIKDSSQVFVGWKDWDPLNIEDPANPSPGLPYCYPYPVGAPLYAEGTVPACRYASNMRAVNGVNPCGLTFFDPDPDHSWTSSDLWDDATQTRQPGTGTNIFYGNSSWAIQVGAIGADVDNVKFQGNVVVGNSGPGFGFKGENGYTLQAEVYACSVSGNPAGDGIQVSSGATVKVNNSRVTNGDSVQTKGGHLDIHNGNLISVKLRVIGSADVYNYNYIGCINRCAGGSGGNKPGKGTYNIEHFNCVGGHVPFDSDYMEIHDHNWFDAANTFEMHEGGGIRLYDGNRLAGGLYRKNHSGPFQIGDCNATEPNYFPNGLSTTIRNGEVCGNWINGGSLSTGGDAGAISVRCNVGNAVVGSSGSVTCEGNYGSWSPASCEDADPTCNYWAGNNSWVDFCATRNCTPPDASPYWP